MKNLMKRIASLLLAATMILGCVMLTSCKDDRKKIVIYTSVEDFQIEYMQKKFAEKFPDYNIIIEYKSSGDHAATLKSAGTNAGCHITHNLEYGYAAELAAAGVLADLQGIVDFSRFTEDVVHSTYYAPELRNGGAIIVNKTVLEEKGLPMPTSYADLLNPIYKGLISMPDPKASGTGYMFYLSLVNTWGVEVALPYFDRLAENVLSFTSSGSGPVNALVGKEVAIALGMTAHAVQEINNGENLEILFFDQGSPYSLYGQGIIAGNETDEAVVEVFKYLAGELTVELCANFYPEKIFADTDFTLENFPQNIHYADMSNNTPERKAELLAKWMH